MEARRYRLGEETILWQLYHDTTHIIIGKEYTEKQVKRWAPDDRDMDEWKERIKKKRPFVVVENDIILWFAELEFDGHIDYFYAHHKWQWKGVGSMLYHIIEKEAIKQGISYLYAEVSIPAKKFFLKKWFIVLAEKNNIVCGAPAPNFMMKKELSKK